MNRTNPLDLSRHTILVTGATSGIGRETAIVLSELGAKVVATGRRNQELDATREKMASGDHALEPFDLTNLNAIPEWVHELARRHGPFDGLVHAAGIRKTVGLRGLSLDALHQTFALNVDSAVMLTKGLRQKGCCRETSAVVLISSVAAIAGTPAASAYAGSKAALIGLAKSLAVELAPEGIRVNCIAPGVVKSEMSDQMRRAVGEAQFAAIVGQHPLGLGTTWDVACAAAYLLSDAGRWITGQTLVLDGGYTAT